MTERNFTTLIPGFYRTRNGQLAEVVQILDPRLADTYPVRGLIGALTEAWHADGRYGVIGRYDLITFLGTEKPREKKPVTKTVTRWVNVYSDGYDSIGHKSESSADKRIKQAPCDRIACVELTGTYAVEEDV